MVDKKRVMVIGINCLPELTGIGKYTGEMVSWLAGNNYETTMITSFPYYPNWEVQKPHSGNWYLKETMFNDNLTLYRCPLYVPKNPSGLKRLLHEASFFLSASLVVFLMLFKKKQDFIFAIAPPFHLGILALCYRFFKGGRVVYHVQDLQIEAAKELKILKHQWMFDLLFYLEGFILKRVNYISTISEGMMSKVEKKSRRKAVFFPNWVDTESFFPLSNKTSLKAQWGYEAHEKVVLYSGSIGEKQGLESLINIADELRERRDLKFLVCGNGPYKREMERMSALRKLDNIKFLPLQDFDVFNKFLNMADIHLVLQKANASDLVMPSKLTAILSVGGLALVTANEGTTLFNVINDHQMGVVVEAEKEHLLEQAIVSIVDNDFEYQRSNARRYAEKFLNKNSVLPQMINDISE